jgi:hypothetical protein
MKISAQMRMMYATNTHFMHFGGYLGNIIYFVLNLHTTPLAKWKKSILINILAAILKTAYFSHIAQDRFG